MLVGSVLLESWPKIYRYMKLRCCLPLDYAWLYVVKEVIDVARSVVVGVTAVSAAVVGHIIVVNLDVEVF